MLNQALRKAKNIGYLGGQLSSINGTFQRPFQDLKRREKEKGWKWL